MSNIKKQIFKKLDEIGYLTDTEVAKLYGKEPNWLTVEEYKRQWERLQKDKMFFSGKKIIHATKAKRRCLVDTLDGSYIVGREFFNEIVKDMEVDNSRPDLKLPMYKKIDH